MNAIKRGANPAKLRRPKGRPKTFDRVDALDAALQVFYEHGYEATSVAQLGEAMGMKPPSLYNAFGDKESLFIEVLGHYHQPYQETVKTLFSEAGSAREAIRKLIDHSKSLHANDNPIGCLVVNSTVNVGTEASPIAEKIGSLHATTESLVRQRLIEAQDSGEIDASVDVVKLARYVCGVLIGAAALARGQKSPEAVVDLLDQGYLGFLALAGLAD